MTNISITLLCNRDCDYCFARPRARETGAMTPELFEMALDHLGRSGMDQARLLGGEPTIHPGFSKFLDHVEKRGLKLLLFTNGLMPRKAVARLSRFPQDKLTILANTHPPDDLTRRQRERFRRACETLGERIMVGCNIHRPDRDPGYTLDLVLKHGLRREVRLGMAHPRIGGENRFLHPRHYPAVGARIENFMKKALDRGVRVELDCGFVPCMFSDKALGLLENMGQAPGKRCNPLPDLLPDGRFIPCYPLAATASLDFPENSDNYRIRAFFEKALAPYRRAGVYKDCGDCGFRRENLCNGGCLATAMTRMRHAAFTVRPPVRIRKKVGFPPSKTAFEVMEKNGREEKKRGSMLGRGWAVPYIDQPISFWKEVRRRHGPSVLEVYAPFPGGNVPSGRPVQKTRFLEDFLSSGILPVSFLINPVVLPSSAAEVAPPLIEKLRRLAGEYGVTRVTVADCMLALSIRENLPDFSITASTLMDIHRPNQAMHLDGVCDTLVPSSRIMRDHDALHGLRRAFSGKIRLIVNESCLPDCIFRTQHFYEMACLNGKPESLCRRLLDKAPWLRLTGSWVLPQHLHLFDGLVDEMKLAGRATLRHPEKYLHVLGRYASGSPLSPDSIGGGPASVMTPIFIGEEFYKHTLFCGKRCDVCRVCKDYYELGGGG